MQSLQPKFPCLQFTKLSTIKQAGYLSLIPINAISSSFVFSDFAVNCFSLRCSYLVKAGSKSFLNS